MAVTLGPGGGQSIPDEQNTFIPGVSYRPGEGFVSVPTNGGSSGGLRSVSETRRQERAREAAYRKAQLEAQQKAQAEKLKAENAKKLAEYKKTQAFRAAQIQEVKRAAAEKQAQLTAKERNSISAAEQLRKAAEARGQAFTRLQAQRFIQQRGGSIGALRSATAKGYSISRPGQDPYTSQRNQILNSKEARINKLIAQNKKMGILTSRSSASRVINARINSELKDLENKAFFDAGGTSGEVMGVAQPTGNVNKIIKKLNDYQKVKSTASIRNQQSNLINELSLLGVTVATTFIGGVVGFIALPKTTWNLIRNPSQIKEIPKAISRGAKNFGKLIIVSPTEALGVIGGELLLLYGTGAAFKIVGKVSSKSKSIIIKSVNKADRVRINIQGKTLKLSKKIPVVKSFVKRAGVVKKIQAKEITRFKSAVEYSNQLKRARSIRKRARAKGKTINIGNSDFIEALDYVEDVADNIAKAKAKQFLREFKKTGGKIGLGKEEEFIETVRRYVKNQLNKSPKFKNLKEYSRYSKPYQVRLLKARRISYANKITKDIISKLRNLKITRQSNSILKKIKSRVRRINKSPQRLKKYITRKKLQGLSRREFMKTGRYRMNKARKIRKVTIEKLKQSSNINQYRKFVDDFFDEITRRQKLDITKLEYRQFKNRIKEKLVRAIKRGDKEEIKRFLDSVKRISNDMNKPSSSPIVKVVEKTSGKKRVRTIKDFKPETPKGQYVEVKQGQQVILQEVKQFQKAKRIQKVIQKPKVYVIQSIQKQRISLRPLISFASYSAQKLKFRSNSKQKTSQKSSSKSRSAQMSRVKQDVRSAQTNKSAQDFMVSQKVLQDVATKQKIPSKIKLVQKQANKKLIRLAIPKQFKSRTLPRKVDTFYVVEKVRGKFKKLYPKPLTSKDARDFAVHSIDNRLSKTAFLIPLGKTRKVIQPPKNIQGYYGRNSRKVRPYRIKFGKKKQLVNGFIEKRKYFQDTVGERTSARNLRKNTPIKRNRIKRKISPARRKQLILQLKKARAAKRRK